MTVNHLPVHLHIHVQYMYIQFTCMYILQYFNEHASPHTYMYMCTSTIHPCTCTCIYMYAYTCTCTCTYVYMYLHVCITINTTSSSTALTSSLTLCSLIHYAWSHFFLPSSPRLHLSLPLISRGIALHSTVESSRLLAAMATEEGDSGKILEGAQALARAVAQLLRAIRPGEKVGHWPTGAVCLQHLLHLFFCILHSSPSLLVTHTYIQLHSLFCLSSPPSLSSFLSPSLHPSLPPLSLPLSLTPPSLLSFFLRWWERC